MPKKVVFMFSGQGSQFYNMGAELYRHNPRFQVWMDHCDDLVWDCLDESILQQLYHAGKTQQPFDRLLYTNPALLSVQYSLARVLQEMGVKPDLLLGYSLGEYTSAVVSSAISLDEGLGLMVDSAKLLEEHATLAPMLAVIANDSLLNEQPQWFNNCYHTGTNFDINFVVSGLDGDISNTQKVLAAKEIISQRLPVNYGFHTPLMAPFEDRYKAIASTLRFAPIKIPTVSSLTGQTIDVFNENYLWRVLREKVAFQDTIKHLLAQGDDYVFIDVGPSGTLAMFVKYILPKDSNSVFLESMNQFGKDNQVFAKLESSLKQLGCLSF